MMIEKILNKTFLLLFEKGGAKQLTDSCCDQIVGSSHYSFRKFKLKDFFGLATKT